MKNGLGHTVIIKTPGNLTNFGAWDKIKNQKNKFDFIKVKCFTLRR